MDGDGSRMLPLRASDPATVGSYRLLGRLGEGGMGTVYLGLTPAGRTVAVKLIRVDRAGDAEFRRRFRGEVKRARQVPPFCTAEVLDADPDHDPPYLVVEYVDGPSLAAVVADRGPLTPSNLHGLAIGVATALTAIHGAGVIHRDLKPSNVLLPPGSPKVIDFGIARAVQTTAGGTSTGSVIIGTVAYMSPERFDAPTGLVLTPAADVFAWGAVVAFAGTGRTPFGGETPEITAVRIMTQPPDLDGLAPQLRSLVGRALAKDPTARPTARELLDELLGAVPGEGQREVAAALADQPALRVAAEQAAAATDQRPVAETRVASPPVTDAGHREPHAAPRPSATDDAIPESAAPAGAAAVAGAPTSAEGTLPAGEPGAAGAPGPLGAKAPPGAAGIAAVMAGAPASGPTVVAASDAPALTAASGGQAPMVAAASGGQAPTVAGTDRWGRVTMAILALIVLAGALTGLGFVAGLLPIDRTDAARGGALPPTVPSATSAPTPATSTTVPTTPPPASTPTATATPSGGPTPSPTATEAAGMRELLRDALAGPGFWQERDEGDRDLGACRFEADAYVATTPTFNSYRCLGPLRQDYRDVRVEVDVRLDKAGSCAAVWFRFKQSGPGGYAARVCEDQVQVVAHGVKGAPDVVALQSFPLPEPLAPDTWARLRVDAVGDDVTLALGGTRIGRLLLQPTVGAAAPAPVSGAVAIGVFPTSREVAPPLSVAFRDIVIHVAERPV